MYLFRSPNQICDKPRKLDDYTLDFRFGYSNNLSNKLILSYIDLWVYSICSVHLFWILT